MICGQILRGQFASAKSAPVWRNSHMPWKHANHGIFDNKKSSCHNSFMIQQKDLPRLKKRAEKIIRFLKKLLPGAKIALKYSNNWELYVAVVLSAQCTDKKVNEVTEKLFNQYRKLEDYIKAKQKDFEKDIRPTGFYRNKAKNILAAAKELKERFGGKMPKTMAEMLTLPGI